MSWFSREKAESEYRKSREAETIRAVKERDARIAKSREAETEMKQLQTGIAGDEMAGSYDEYRIGVDAKAREQLGEKVRDASAKKIAAAKAAKALGISPTAFGFDVAAWRNHLLTERQLEDFDGKLSQWTAKRDTAREEMTKAEREFADKKQAWHDAIAAVRHLESTAVNARSFKGKHLRLFGSAAEVGDRAALQRHYGQLGWAI